MRLIPILTLSLTALAFGCGANNSTTTDAGGGGTTNTGGSNTGGNNTGGTSTGGSNTGGNSTGGTDTGGSTTTTGDGGSGGGTTTSSSTSTTCTQITEDGTKIGIDCSNGGNCPTGYTCQEYDGFAVTYYCAILCQDSCQCPDNISCVTKSDKSKSWKECNKP